MNYKTGCIKDKPDARDYIYKSSGKPNFPEKFMFVNTKIKNQGSVSSCVAHALSTIKEVQEFYETGQFMEFSVGWLYGFRNTGQWKGEGMYPREALSNLLKYGNVLKSNFPENMEYDQLQPLINKRKSTCLEKGKKYRIKAYAKVKSINDVKKCLYADKSPVLIIIDVYSGFNIVGKNGIVPLKNGTSNSSHAMAIIGWKKINNAEYWICQNSYGSDWGDGGFCYIRVGSNIITDMYTVTDLNNVIK